MNFKITKESHDELSKIFLTEYPFGSRLHGVATEESDYDYIRIIPESFYDRFTTKAKYLPNIHSFQYEDVENNSQYVYLTETQFYRNLFSGDGNMIADIVLLSNDFNDAMVLCRTYRIIKGYLGVAKRDLKLHGNIEKKRFQSARCIYMARCLMYNIKPSVSDIVTMKELIVPSTEDLMALEQVLRDELNDMYNKNSIKGFPEFKEEDVLVKMMVDANNMKEYRC